MKIKFMIARYFITFLVLFIAPVVCYRVYESVVSFLKNQILRFRFRWCVGNIQYNFSCQLTNYYYLYNFSDNSLKNFVVMVWNPSFKEKKTKRNFYYDRFLLIFVSYFITFCYFRLQSKFNFICYFCYITYLYLLLIIPFTTV